MSESFGVRLRLLIIVEILTLYTDEFNFLTVDELIEKLEEYGLTVTRRTLLNDIKTLNKTSFKVICVNRPQGKGYYIAKSYSYVSLHLMLEAVYSSRVLTSDGVAVIENHLRSNVCIPTLELLTETTKNLNFQSGKEVVSLDVLRNLRLAIHSGKQALLTVTQRVPGDLFSNTFKATCVTVNPWKIVITSETSALVFTLPDDPASPKFLTMNRIAGCEVLDTDSDNEFDGDPLTSLNYFDNSEASASRRKYDWLIISFEEKYSELVENYFNSPMQFRRSEKKGYIDAKLNTLVDEKLIGWLYIHSDKITVVAPKGLSEFMSRGTAE